MFIEIISKEGELSWINLKQVLVIKIRQANGRLALGILLPQ